MNDEEVQEVMDEVRRQKHADRRVDYNELRRIEQDAQRVAVTPEFRRLAKDVEQVIGPPRNVDYHTHGHSDPNHHVGTCFPGCRAGSCAHPHRRAASTIETGPAYRGY